MTRPKRIGIFGGSFDPPHIGHLLIAEFTRRQLKLDWVYLVPAFQPPHKTGDHPSTAKDRMAMTRLSIRGNKHLRVSDLELRRKGISYTVDTVRSFRRRFPQAELFLILGGDSVVQFHSWRSPDRILQDVTIAAYNRPGSGRAMRNIPRDKVHVVKGPRMSLSSTDIRIMIAKGDDIRYLLRENVRRFIMRRGLYGA